MKALKVKSTIELHIDKRVEDNEDIFILSDTSDDYDIVELIQMKVGMYANFKKIDSIEELENVHVDKEYLKEEAIKLLKF